MSKKKDQCCGVGCPVTVNSVFILSLLSAATCSNTQVEELCWRAIDHGDEKSSSSSFFGVAIIQRRNQ